MLLELEVVTLMVLKSLLYAFSVLSIVASMNFTTAQTLPLNDAISDAILLEGTVATGTGSNVGATIELSEGEVSGWVGGKSVWWKWIAPVDGPVVVDTMGSSFDTLLGVYVELEASQVPVANDDDTGGGYASLVSFAAAAGNTYLLRVDGINPGVQQYIGGSRPYLPATNPLNAASGDIALHVWAGDSPPWITQQPKSQSLLIGGRLILSAADAGYGLKERQWWKDGSPIADATNSTFTIASTAAADNGAYLFTVSNALGAATSAVANIDVGPVRVVQQPASITVAEGYDLGLSIRFAAGASATTMWHKDGVPILGAVTPMYTITNVQFTDAGVYSILMSNALGSAFSRSATVDVVTPFTFMTLAGRPGTPGFADGSGRTALFNHPAGIAVDNGGSLYVTEWSTNNTIRRITPDGQVTTLAGLPGVAGTNDGVGSTALFNFPEDIAVDAATNLYVADNQNHTIRKITPDSGGTQWTVGTLAGSPGVAGWKDGPVSQALFRQPSALALDAAGNLYVAEWANCSIRKLTPDGIVTTVVGDTKAKLTTPTGIAVDQFQNLYVTEQGGIFQTVAVLKVNTGGIPSRYGSLPYQAYGGTLDATGNLYVAGSIGAISTLRIISPGGIPGIVAGVDSPGFADGCGRAVRFWARRSRVVLDKHGNVYVTDNLNHVIRKGVPFAVASLPQSVAVPAETSVDLTATITGTESPSIQWLHDHNPLLGETNTTLGLGPVDRSNSGVYSMLVSNALGQWIEAGTTVIGYHPHRIMSIETSGTNGTRLLSQDVDGGLPAAPDRLELQWTESVQPLSGANWQSSGARAAVTNGMVFFEELPTLTNANRFYQIIGR